MLNLKLQNLNNLIAQFQKIGINIHTEIQPLLRDIQPLSLDTYIDNSTIKIKNKKYYKNLFKKYIDYCNNKFIESNSFYKKIAL